LKQIDQLNEELHKAKNHVDTLTINLREETAGLQKELQKLESRLAQ